MKSLKFLKPALATTLAIAFAWLLSGGRAQAGYTVTLQQVGPDVVATGSGTINLHGLNFYQSGSQDPRMTPHVGFLNTGAAAIYTGPISSSVDIYWGPYEPTSFGCGDWVSASSGSGDMVGVSSVKDYGDHYGFLIVPLGYVSGTALSDTATYSGTTLASLGVTAGTYVWKWGSGANQNFTLNVPAFAPPPSPAPDLTNISTRASVQTGRGVTVAGFIITGTGPKQVMIRGLGPTLTNSKVTGVLADPTLELHDASGNPIFSNNDWKDTQQAAIEATGLAPSFDLESAILITLMPGPYTAILSGDNGSTGVGLVEVYDTSTDGSAQLANVSTRGVVGTGQNVLIAGFITGGGNGSTEVVVRGLGPSLAQFGLAEALVDPVVSVFDGNGNVVQNDNDWKDTQEVAIEATGLAPTNNFESSIVVSVPAGNYTAILSGNGGGTGIGLLEVYKLL